MHRNGVPAECITEQVTRLLSRLEFCTASIDANPMIRETQRRLRRYERHTRTDAVSRLLCLRNRLRPRRSRGMTSEAAIVIESSRFLFRPLMRIMTSGPGKLPPSFESRRFRSDKRAGDGCCRKHSNRSSDRRPPAYDDARRKTRLAAAPKGSSGFEYSFGRAFWQASHLVHGKLRNGRPTR